MEKLLTIIGLMILLTLPLAAQQYPPYIFLDAALNPYPSGSGSPLGSNPPYALCYTNVTGQALPCNFGGSGPSFSYPLGTGFTVVTGGAAWGTTLTDPLAVGHGGTGSATASGALTNLGALALTGGTMTGAINSGVALPSGSPATSIGATCQYSPNEPLNVNCFGAVGDTRMVADTNVSAASATLTSATAAFTSGDTGKTVTVAMGPNAVTTGTYTSGITTTGTTGQTCILTTSNGGGTGGVATVYLTGTNTIAGSAVLYFTTFGTGYTSAPTTATVAAGTASACSGTATISTGIHPLPVMTTATYVNATTITLGVTATNAVSSGYLSIGTDNTTAIQNAITQAQTNNGSVYIPTGFYTITGLTNSAPVTIFGDGVTTTPDGSGETTTVAPYLLGSVLWMAKPSTDALNLALAQQGTSLRDIGIVFAPAMAFYATGDGFDASVTGDAFGIHNTKWRDLKVWGTDGNHYAYDLTNSVLVDLDSLNSYGGGGLRMSSTSGAACCSGNSTITGFYAANYAGGASDGINITSAGSNAENLITMVRPEVNTLASSAAVGFAWVPSNNTSTRLGYDIPSNINDVVIIGPDQENGNVLFPFNGSFCIFNLQPGATNYSYCPVWGNTRASALVGGMEVMPTPNPTFTTFDAGIVAIGNIVSSTGLSGEGILFGEGAAANNAWVNINPAGNLYWQYLTNTTQTRVVLLSKTSTTGFQVEVPFINGSTAAKVTGCGLTAASVTGNGTAGKITLAGNSCTAVITVNGFNGTSNMTTTNGWSCTVNDETTAAGNTGMYFSSNTTSTASLVVPATAGTTDVVDFSCRAF